MRTTLLIFLVGLLALARPASAHRLDEYLQAATIDVARDRVTLRLRLTPGVGVRDAVMADIDPDGDGALSPAERAAYAERVRRDLTPTADGRELALRAIDATFAPVADLREGLGEVALTFAADLPTPARSIALENRHRRDVSAYLANALVPTDADVRIVGQSRSVDQSSYRVDYAIDGVAPRADVGARSLAVPFVYAGARHILVGWDHLLFVAALALAARSLRELVLVVGTFTVAHTIALSLAACGVLSASPRVVEPMIAASIVVVALQNFAAPRGGARLASAFGFGLFHGLGFAGGLSEAMGQLDGRSLAAALVAFAIGVELGHQLVVLPLYGLLRATRGVTPNVALVRLGSAAISVAGAYYVCVALNLVG